jgi:antitoxin component YwqK of YwqJK toxin-antitoxin module
MKIFVFFLITLFATFATAKTVKEFYPDGTIKSAVTYKDGKKNGVDHAYYPDGATLKHAYSYAYGRLHGLQQEYDKNALLLQEENYRHGRLDGRSRYYQNGLLVSEADYQNGLLDGEYKEFFPSGMIRLVIFWRRGKATEGYKYTEEGSRTSLSAETLKLLNTDKKSTSSTK